MSFFRHRGKIEIYKISVYLVVVLLCIPVFNNRYTLCEQPAEQYYTILCGATELIAKKNYSIVMCASLDVLIFLRIYMQRTRR